MTAQIRNACLLVLLVLAAFPWASARADIYRCTAAGGQVLYSDAPCPRGVLHNSNITATVGACTTAECLTQREQAAASARERLRSDKEQLAEFAEQRRRDEIDSARERSRVEDLLWRQAIEARLSATTNEAAYSYGPAYPYYPIYPVYSAVRACGWRCAGRHPGFHNGVPARRSWGIPIRLNGR